MLSVPKVMSTQHPDNAMPAPFADERGVLKGDGEVDEAVDVFALGCEEQMWDSEGKEADNQVVRKLLTGYPAFFQNEFQLGRGRSADSAGAESARRTRYAQIHGGGTAERTLGLGCGAELLRRGAMCLLFRM